MSANDLLAAVFMFKFRINCTGTSKTVMSMKDRKGTVVTRRWLSSHQLTHCHLCFFTRASAQQPSCHHCFFTRVSAQATHASITTLPLRGCLPRVAGQQPSHHHCSNPCVTSVPLRGLLPSHSRVTIFPLRGCLPSNPHVTSVPLRG